MRSITVLGASLTALGLSLGLGHTPQPSAAQEGRTREKRTLQVTGDWTGTWGVYSPAQPAAPSPGRYALPQMRLDCKVEQVRPGKWQATFQGDAGGAYKYTIKMVGRREGDVVLFSGSADLGEKDGGVYDWIGRATETEFVGFYTSQKYTGTFALARPKSSG